MSDTKDKSNRSIGQRGSSSRLSASAKPFNWSTHVKEYDFGQQSFSSFSLFDYGGCYDQSLHSDSNAMPSSFPKATQDAIFGDHFSSLSYNEFPRQGAEDSLGDSAFMKEPQSLLNANDKIISHGKDTIGEGTEKKSGELANNGTINSMFVATSELLITSLDTPAFSLKPNGNESGVPVQSSSVVLAQNDSDVDSPCWKGTAAYESPFGGTKPMDSRLPKSEIEALKTLNPHAPDFIPESAKQFAEFHESECHENAPFSFLMDPSPVATFSSNEQKFVDSVKAGTFSSKGSNVIGTRCFDNISDGGKKYSLAKKSESCSEPNSLLGDQPFLVEDCLASSGQGLTRTNITGSIKDTEDTVRNGSSCVTSAVTGNFRTSSCSRDAVPSLVDEKLQGASKSSSPKLDVQSVISSMHELSKLLLWSYSNDLGSVNEHEHDMILHIINNLYKCMPKKLGQRVSIPESGHHCTLDRPMKLPDRKKESKLTELKNKIIPHDLERQKGCSTTFEKKVSSPPK